MLSSLSRRSLLALAPISALALASCSSNDSESSADATVAADATGAALPTITEGVLTIATGEPAYSPWVENDDPESGEGFEAAVAYAVAGKLGFSDDQVTWVRTSFDSAIAPGAKDWDFNLQQFSITEERKAAVDFSSAYYTTPQAVVTVAGSAAAEASSIADLTDVLFGVQTGTTSQSILETAVAPTQDAMPFNNSQDTVQALMGGQVDAIVVDLPTALYLVAAELDEGIVVGQFADSTGGDEYGLVLPKDSALTAPVTAAVDALREDGTLDELAQTWLSDSVDVPVLS